jgi:hypothetical protein
MKPLLGMTQDELIELVSYASSTSGGIVFYSEIEQIFDDSIIYKGSIRNVANPETLKKIKQGKIRYEAYLLSSSKYNIETMLSARVDVAIQTNLDNKLNTVSNILSTNTDRLQKEVQSVSAVLSTVHDLSSKFTETLESLLSDIDGEDIAHTKEVFKSHTQSLNSGNIELTKVINKLNSLWVNAKD